ncbi:unnamed protein product [Hydatigera taeniaeformis]|uniref:DUF3108 domain-containing protein n=1 Tax=Hydatigena taeniaeformis TaxID=6205 RepID=A0A0R3WQF2_HYDTA|nr:unnamed protein product [Hydatigera taeniaeformis]
MQLLERSKRINTPQVESACARGPFKAASPRLHWLPILGWCGRGLDTVLEAEEFTATNARTPSAGEYSHSSPPSSEEVSISPPLDVTDLTAHCLRLEFTNEPVAALHIDDTAITPARLVLVGKLKDSKETGDSQTATRVWLVGQRPGRFRVRLASVVDSPLVRAALPTSLARLRKQQNQIKRSGSAAAWDRQQFQTLWVTVTNNDWIWPVGITAQLVTDLTVTVTQQDRLEGKFPSGGTPLYHQSDRGKVSDSGFTFYTAHVRFSGSRVGRSKSVPMVPNSGGATPLDAFAFQQGGHIPLSKRVKRQLVKKTLPRQGLLVVTVQFSDGSVLPWHRIMEVRGLAFSNGLNHSLFRCDILAVE